MGSATAAITTSMIQDSFNELEKQRELIASCTLLWKELSDHFSSMEKDLQIKSESLKNKRQTLDLFTKETLNSLHHREETIDRSVDLAISNLDSLRQSAISALASDPEDDLSSKLRSLCKKMDSEGLLDLIVSKRKEADVMRLEIPAALSDSIDPAKLVLDAISRVFPVDKRSVKLPPDLTWACVLILEGLVLALVDPELGKERLLVTRSMKERARAMAVIWKEGIEGRGGVGSLKPADVHTFLQHLVTFGVMEKADRDLYQKLVVGYAWRKQMPKLAISLGLENRMSDIIEELIGKRQQLDAINFAYEAGLQDKFPPVPLLKAFLENSKKVASAVSEDQNNSGQAADNASRKEQAALRAVIKCVEERKLGAEFPLEDLRKRLENLEKAKLEKKKPSGGGSSSSSSSAPANKRTRANSGGPMPPAKAGRLTNHAYVSSFPAAPTYIRSPSSYTAIPPSSHSSYPPSHTTYSSSIPTYPYDRPAAHSVYGSRSPPTFRDPYAYPTEEVAPPAIGVSYTSAPMNYTPYPYCGYSTGLAPAYQQAYYR